MPPSKVRSSIVILTQTLAEEFPYSTLGLRPRVEYGNSSPRVWIRITILLPPSEGGMYRSLNKEALLSWTESKSYFCFQTAVGILPEQAQALSGQVCKRTREKYLRGNQNNLDVFGAALACAATGGEAVVPPPSGQRAVAHLAGAQRNPKTSLLSLRPTEKPSTLRSEFKMC